MIHRLTPFTQFMLVIGLTLVLLVLWEGAPHPLLIGWYPAHHLATFICHLEIRAWPRVKSSSHPAPMWNA